MNFRTLVRRRYAIAPLLVMLMSLPTYVRAQLNCSDPTNPNDIADLRAWAWDTSHQFDSTDGSFDHVFLVDSPGRSGPEAWAWPATDIRDWYSPHVWRVVAEVELKGGGYDSLGLPVGKSRIMLCREQPRRSPPTYWSLIIPQDTAISLRGRKSVGQHSRREAPYAIVDWRITPAWTLCLPCPIFGWCELQ